MGILGRLFGAHDEATPVATRRVAPTRDQRAVERYRLLLRTAPLETIEQVHAEAFTRLTEPERALVYEQLSKGAGTGERPLSSEPATLARAAMRKEFRNPGSLERTLAEADTEHLDRSLIGTIARYVVSSALASAFLPWDADASA